MVKLLTTVVPTSVVVEWFDIRDCRVVVVGEFFTTIALKFAVVVKCIPGQEDGQVVAIYDRSIDLTTVARKFVVVE